MDISWLGVCPTIHVWTGQSTLPPTIASPPPITQTDRVDVPWPCLHPCWLSPRVVGKQDRDIWTKMQHAFLVGQMIKVQASKRYPIKTSYCSLIVLVVAYAMPWAKFLVNRWGVVYLHLIACIAGTQKHVNFLCLTLLVFTRTCVCLLTTR